MMKKPFWGGTPFGLDRVKRSHVEDPVSSHYRSMSKNRSFENNNSSHFIEQV